MIEIVYFDQEVRRAKIQELDAVKAHPLWIDVTGITRQEAEVLRVAFDLHPLTVEDLLHANSRIKVEEFKQYVYCVFYGVQRPSVQHRKQPILLVEIDFVLGERYLISSHPGELPSLTELKGNPTYLDQLFRRGVEFIFHRILDREIDNYFPVLESIDDQIEDIEEKVTGRPRHPLLLRILALKRLVVLIKKVALPQREKISALLIPSTTTANRLGIRSMYTCRRSRTIRMRW